MAVTPARHIRVADDLWNAAKEAADRRDTTRTEYLVARLVELVEADRTEQAFRNGLTPTEEAAP